MNAINTIAIYKNLNLNALEQALERVNILKNIPLVYRDTFWIFIAALAGQIPTALIFSRMFHFQETWVVFQYKYFKNLFNI